MQAQDHKGTEQVGLDQKLKVHTAYCKGNVLWPSSDPLCFWAKILISFSIYVLLYNIDSKVLIKEAIIGGLNGINKQGKVQQVLFATYHYNMVAPTIFFTCSCIQLCLFHLPYHIPISILIIRCIYNIKQTCISPKRQTCLKVVQSVIAQRDQVTIR